jgi:serine/threonine-protein kinase RsbW
VNPNEVSNKILHLETPAKAEYLSLLRLVVAGVANQIGLSTDSVADVKVALSEASSNVIRHAYESDCPEDSRVIEIDCFDDEGTLVVEIIDHGNGMSIPPPPSDGLGFGIMSSVMDKVDVETDDGGTSVLMRKVSVSGRRR